MIKDWFKAKPFTRKMSDPSGVTSNDLLNFWYSFFFTLSIKGSSLWAPLGDGDALALNKAVRKKKIVNNLIGSTPFMLQRHFDKYIRIETQFYKQEGE